MKKQILLALAVMTIMIPSQVRAQGVMWRPGPGLGVGYGYGGSSGGFNSGQPAVSPYLNLLRGGSSAAINYYGLVRPAMQFQSAIQNLQQQVNDANAPGFATGMGGQQAMVTGSRPRFMNTSGYFLSGVPLGNRMGGGSSYGMSGASLFNTGSSITGGNNSNYVPNAISSPTSR